MPRKSKGTKKVGIPDTSAVLSPEWRQDLELTLSSNLARDPSRCFDRIACAGWARRMPRPTPESFHSKEHRSESFGVLHSEPPLRSPSSARTLGLRVGRCGVRIAMAAKQLTSV